MNEIFTFSEKGEKRKLQLFETALTVFSEYGYRKAGIDDIAKRMHVASGTIYRYVKDKQDLYQKSVAYGFELWQAYAIEQAQEQSDPLLRFRSLCIGAFSYMQKEPRLRKILASDPALFPVLDGSDPFPSINTRSIELLQSFIEEAVEAKLFSVEQPKMVALILFSLYRLSIERAYVEDSESEQQLFLQSLDLVLNGMLVR